MAKARLLDKPEDYKRLGINPDKVELWEDGRRDDASSNHFEWWYFDAILDDGRTVVVQFLNKNGRKISDNKDHPTVFMKVTMPDGKRYEEEPSFKENEATYSTEKCDVTIGLHHIEGDLKNYTIHVEPINGLGVDLKMTNLTSPYRPGTSYIELGDEEKYYTWLCVAPRCEVTGTVVVDGKATEVHGFGYHDHQWGSVNFHKEWNHWVWARQNFDDYSMLVFDMVTTENNDYTRFPLVFIQDKNGNVVFENSHDVTCEVLGEYHDDEASDKDYPNKIHYIFKNDGKEVDYTLTAKKTIETKGTKNVPKPMKLALKVMGIAPSYTRYLADGELILKDGKEEIKRSSELIYEFMYPGKTYKGHM